MSEKSEAEEGSKITAEELIAAQVTIAKAREKVIKEEAEAKAKEYAEEAQKAAEEVAIAEDPDAANAATRAANVKRDQEVAEENANILNIVA